MTTPATKPDPASSYRSAFDEYIKSLKPSAEEESANKLLGDLTLQRKKDYEEALTRGETMGFATGEAARVDRNNSFGVEAAANAVDAFTRQRGAMTEAQKARLDFEKTLLPKEEEGFTLGKDQIRYDKDGKAVAYGPSATDPGAGGQYTTGANPTVDAYIKGIQEGRYKPSDIPDEYRDQVAQGLSSAKPTMSQSSKNVIGIIDSLLGATSGLTGITGRLEQYKPGFMQSDAQRLASNQLDQLLGILKLENRQQLKGSGAISDFEFKILGQAATSIGRNLGDADAVSQLQLLKDKLTGNAPIPTTPTNGDVWKAPDGTEYEFENGGWVQTSNDSESFSSVGSDTNQASKGKGVILGYDINSYATDPKHEQKIATLVNNIGDVKTPIQIDSYIRKVAPNSPVKALDVMAASTTYGVPPTLILAIMQQDSSFGTAGKAVRTKNPGNVGNTDSGATQTYPSWRDGVFAVAKNLSKRRA